VPERRLHVRHLVCIPAYLRRTTDRQRIALIRNISLSGALLLTRKELADGEPLDLSLHFGGIPPLIVHDTTAQVVRVESLEAERAGLWLHAAGVSFEQPLAEIEEHIRRVAARLRASLGRT
jgi:hypothetical protein